jgi:probable phosphoglycerate mutase
MNLRISNQLISDRAPNTRVIIVGYAQSNFRSQEQYKGLREQSGLSELDRHYAHQTGAALKGLTIDAVYTSPLQLARETASEIISAVSLSSEHLPALQATNNFRGIDLPTWYDLPFKYVQEQFAQDYRCWEERPYQFQVAYSQAEEMARTSTSAIAATVKQQCFPLLDLYEQAKRLWQQLLSRHAGKTVLVVSDSSTNRALIITAIGLHANRYSVLQQSDYSISSLYFPANLGVSAQLEAMNLTTHLGESLPQLDRGKQGLRLLLVPSGSIDSLKLHCLAELLKPVTINFSLSTCSISQKIAECLLQSHPTTVQLQVLKQDFSQVWLQTIYCSRRSLNSSQLVTGIVVGGEAAIKGILGQVVGIKSEQLCSLRLVDGAIGVIHYPSADCLPVLQGMNISNLTLASLVGTGVNQK